MVTIANDNRLASIGRCLSFQWSMQRHKVGDEMRIVALTGCDAVLGVERLKMFGPVVFYFNQLRLTFIKNDPSL